MSSEHTQARLQRIERDVRSLNATVSVLASVDSGAAKKRIKDTFADHPRMTLIYRGVQAGLTQQEIADVLKDRELPGASQPRVSESLTELEELGFIKRAEKGQPVTLPGWDSFGLARTLKKTLRDRGVHDLD